MILTIWVYKKVKKISKKTTTEKNKMLQSESTISEINPKEKTKTKKKEETSTQKPLKKEVKK